MSLSGFYFASSGTIEWRPGPPRSDYPTFATGWPLRYCCCLGSCCWCCYIVGLWAWASWFTAWQIWMTRTSDFSLTEHAVSAYCWRHAAVAADAVSVVVGTAVGSCWTLAKVARRSFPMTSYDSWCYSITVLLRSRRDLLFHVISSIAVAIATFAASSVSHSLIKLTCHHDYCLVSTQPMRLLDSSYPSASLVCWAGQMMSNA